MQVEPLSKMNPNFTQTITIGITNLNLTEDDEKCRKYLPINNSLDVNLIRNEYGNRIFNFDNYTSLQAK
jgi:hypothetical protein